jgi:hypothetical protein
MAWSGEFLWCSVCMVRCIKRLWTNSQTIGTTQTTHNVESQSTHHCSIYYNHQTSSQWTLCNVGSFISHYVYATCNDGRNYSSSSLSPLWRYLHKTVNVSSSRKMFHWYCCSAALTELEWNQTDIDVIREFAVENELVELLEVVPHSLE